MFPTETPERSEQARNEHETLDVIMIPVILFCNVDISSSSYSSQRGHEHRYGYYTPSLALPANHRGSCARQPNEKEPPKLYLDEIEVSLEDFEQRWSTPASHPDTGPEPEIVSEMTDALAHGTLKETARLFHQTCPDDWTLEINVAFGAKLQSYYEHGQDKEQAPMLAATIRFRWEMGLLTDYLVSLFDLPMPCNEICILWCQRAWQDTMDMTDSAWKVRWDRIENALGSSFDVLPREDQGPPSYRPRWYLTAALVEADRSEDETLTIISAAGHFTEILKEFHYEYYEY